MRQISTGPALNRLNRPFADIKEMCETQAQLCDDKPCLHKPPFPGTSTGSHNTSSS